jgi:hypothetical protein
MRIKVPPVHSVAGSFWVFSAGLCFLAAVCLLTAKQAQMGNNDPA